MVKLNVALTYLEIYRRTKRLRKINLREPIMFSQPSVKHRIKYIHYHEITWRRYAIKFTIYTDKTLDRIIS